MCWGPRGVGALTGRQPPVELRAATAVPAAGRLAEVPELDPQAASASTVAQLRTQRAATRATANGRIRMCGHIEMGLEREIGLERADTLAA
jgi:hypothetical protein